MGAKKVSRYYTPIQRVHHFTGPVDANGCKPWLSTRKADGYGHFEYRGRKLSAARTLLEDQLGRPLEYKMEACHTCDNTWCVALDHLYEGTHSDNMKDRINRGRANMPFGETHANAVLTARDVRRIRKDRRIQKAIAADYGVTQSLISRIKLRRAWAHVT